MTHYSERKKKMSKKKLYILPVLFSVLLTGCKDIYFSVTKPLDTASVSTEASTTADTKVTNAGIQTGSSQKRQELTSAVTEHSETTTTVVTTQPPANLISGLTHYDQNSGYATACESLAAVSLLRFYGTQIEPAEFISKYLPVADYPVRGRDGMLHGESPWEYFIGDPMRTNGYGCYSGAIMKALEQIVPGRAAVLRDVSLNDLCRTFVDNGHPVMIWATIDMKPTREGHSWILPNGTLFTFIRPEHALLLIGSDDQSYFFCDSHREESVTAYSRKSTETAYKAMQKQAIVIMNQPELSEEPHTEEKPDTDNTDQNNP